MNMLSLFSGIGGIDLAAKNAGIKTVAFCEQEPFCQKVLSMHWPNVPIISDVHHINKELLQRANIPKLNIISGGFPCQPFSTANPHRRGLSDERSLFPAMLRIVSEFQPTWVVGENVMGFKDLGLDALLAEMENIGYSARAFIIPACGVSAPHRRYRIFILGTNASGFEWNHDVCREIWWPTSYPGTWNGRLLVKPGLPRVVNGVPTRLDSLTKSRLKALGNAVVPQQIEPIFHLIKAIDAILKK
ncbi:DNA cytosine methyltransferase [Paenibacillus sp. FSL H7-0323]|jgi:DNA (cytosine-5)-methyltransferase 1|uniref:DNA cytosine methyltransferase n=1 Tax=Paenibacillus sp. FSL H7-0323 TaxID=2921433 RepID=UPI0030FBBB45